MCQHEKTIGYIRLNQETMGYVSRVTLSRGQVVVPFSYLFVFSPWVKEKRDKKTDHPKDIIAIRFWQ